MAFRRHHRIRKIDPNKFLDLNTGRILSKIEVDKIDEVNLNNKIIGQNDNIKIAVLLTGHIRRNNILNGINNLNENVDIFIHTWDNLGLKGNETNIEDKTDINFVLKEIGKFKNVKDYLIENNKTFIKNEKILDSYFNFSSPEVFIKSQLYSVNKCFELMENFSITENKKYDIIIKFRFDSILDYFNLSDKTINDILNHNIIFTPNRECKHDHMDYGTSCWACDNMYYKYDFKDVHVFEHTNIVCDIFAYGNFNSMKKYCNLYNVYDDLNLEFKKINLESLKTHNKNLIFKNNNYILEGHHGHLDSLYFFYCSYPERLLQKYLKDFMLIESKDIKITFTR